MVCTKLVCTIVCCALFVSPGFIEAQEKKEEPTPAVIPTPSSAVGWALADLALVAPSDRPFQRYIWIPSFGDKRWIAAINFTINTAVSHSSVIQLGAECANGWLLRYDLRRLAPSPQQLAKLIQTWDSLALQDSYFHISSSTLGVSKLPAAILGPHLKQPEAVALAGLNLSSGGIYRGDWFIAKALSTLEGGAYYEFLQIQRVVEKNRTPQGVFLASLGVFEEQTKLISGDERIAIFRSNVTSKARRADILYGLGRRGALATITHDISDNDVQVEAHPLRNLLAFQDKAREVIVQKANGMHVFALFDNKGNFQDAVPPDIAADHLVPAPHTKNLQPAISCIRCHGPFDGYHPLLNDVQTLLTSKLDVFTDLVDVNNSREAIIDRLAGLYSGQPDLPDAPLGRARRDYKAAVYKITQDSYPDEVSPVVAVSNHISEIYANYRYDVVSPQKAALELGLHSLDEFVIGEGEAVDPVVGSLKAGISVNRSDYEHVYADMALQVSLTRKKQEN